MLNKEMVYEKCKMLTYMRNYYSLCISIINNRKENASVFPYTIHFLCLTFLLNKVV